MKNGLNAISRMRFIDIPASEQNAIEGDTADFADNWHTSWDEQWAVETEIMSDSEFNLHSNLRAKAKYETGDWEFYPSATLRYKSADSNSEYHSAAGQSVGAGVDFKSWRWSALSCYLLNLWCPTRPTSDSIDNAYDSSIIEDRYQANFTSWFWFL